MIIIFSISLHFTWHSHPISFAAIQNSAELFLAEKKITRNSHRRTRRELLSPKFHLFAVVPKTLYYKAKYLNWSYEKFGLSPNDDDDVDSSPSSHADSSSSSSVHHHAILTQSKFDDIYLSFTIQRTDSLRFDWIKKMSRAHIISLLTRSLY